MGGTDERHSHEEALHDALSTTLAMECFVQQLLGHPGFDNDVEQRKLIEDLHGEVKRLRRVLGGARETIVDFDLRQTLAPPIAACIGRAQDVTFDVPAGLVVQGQPDATVRIVQNLLDNAIHHGRAGHHGGAGHDGGAGHHSRAGAISVCARRCIGHIEIDVTDQGRGMSQDQLDRVFERGYSTGSDTNRGLGLCSARRLAEAQHGQLAIVSSPGKGTRVRVTLPAASTIDLDEAVAQRSERSREYAA